MKRIVFFMLLCLLLLSCAKMKPPGLIREENPELPLFIPEGFPTLNPSIYKNRPTKYGVSLGKALFQETRLSGDNRISCSSCHRPSNAFADNYKQARGIYGRVGLRNTPPIQNLAFMNLYNWDGHIQQIEKQPLVPIISQEEMDASVVEIIKKLERDDAYKTLFNKAFGDDKITPDRIYRSLAQYMYTLISFNSKYDLVQRNAGARFTDSEQRGYAIFKKKCTPCHNTALFTDQSFRNIGFPTNPNPEEVGRARVTGLDKDRMRFRVPSLRNVEYTAPYGSFGQFGTLKEVLDYLDQGVLPADNLDILLKNQGNRIAMSEQEKEDIINFIKTLSDPIFVDH